MSQLFLFNKPVNIFSFKDEDINIYLTDIENSGILGAITNNGENAKTLDKINENDTKKSIKNYPNLSVRIILNLCMLVKMCHFDMSLGQKVEGCMKKLNNT